MAFYRPLRRLLLLALLALSGSIPSAPLVAQVVTGEGPRYPGTTGNASAIDTSARREGRERTEQTAGLFEGPIDPDRYRVGPSDVVTVSIIGIRSVQHELEVSPDGRILVPSVGKVDVRGKTLSQVERAIIEAASRVYSGGSVAVALRRMRKFKVHVSGAVLTPSTVVATPTTRVSEAIALAGGPSSQAENRRIVVRHTDGTSTEVDLLPFFTLGDRHANPELSDGDHVIVPFQDSRSVVQIFGAVQRPGEFTYRDGDSISTMIRYAFGPTSAADLDSIEVVGIDDRGAIVARTTHRLDPDGGISGDRALRPGDRIFIRSLPDYMQTERVVVGGEVLYPGSFAIERGTTRLRDVIESAGGFTDDASVEDAALYRRRLAGEVDNRFATIELIDPEKRTPEQMEYWGQKIREFRRPGEMTVDFVSLMRGDETQNLVLVGDDSIYVPERKGVIRVTGKVRNPGAVTFQPGLSYADYIALAGGYGWRADDGATEVVKEGSGEIFLASNDDDYTLEAGDSIWVPEEQPGNLGEVFTTALTIIAQVATIIAVVVSVSASSGGNGN